MTVAVIFDRIGRTGATPVEDLIVTWDDADVMLPEPEEVRGVLSDGNSAVFESRLNTEALLERLEAYCSERVRSRSADVMLQFVGADLDHIMGYVSVGIGRNAGSFEVVISDEGWGRV